jgi:deoxyribodipyrimidine photo-lyase
VPPVVVVFTRDLRVHDQPALAAACASSEAVVPAFVLDDALLTSTFHRPNRARFLGESLRDLDASLHERGGSLVLRRGDWTNEVLRLAQDSGAGQIRVADDASAFARRRLVALEGAAAAVRVEVVRHDTHAVVPPGAALPTGGDHYQVFTPYFRKWATLPWRPVARTPDTVVVPAGLASLDLSAVADLLLGLAPGARSSDVMTGGETEARRRLNAWTRVGLDTYGDRHDDLPGDATSRMSPYLHFGCISALEIATKLRARDGGEPYVRQLCWRDFYLQVLAARPDAAWHDYQDRGDRWNDDPEALRAWQDGRTGYPVVDAGMRQLVREGFMHNRARMVVASFLTKDLYVDWRAGAAHFLDWLLDGDIANNNLNWQWTAGTGTDSNPHRVFNPTVQGTRFDPAGDYVRRYVEELGDVPGKAAHDPDPATRERVGYPAPIVDHREAIAEFKARRSAST